MNHEVKWLGRAARRQRGPHRDRTYAVRVRGVGQRWLYFSGAVGIQCGPRVCRHMGTLQDARDLIRAAKKSPASRRWLTGLEEGDRFVRVKFIPKKGERP